MYGHTRYCEKPGVKCQSPLVLNLIIGEEVKGSPLPRLDTTEIWLEVLAKSLQTCFKIMKWTVAKCPNIELKNMGESVPSLPNFGSMVSLMWQDYFNRYFRPQLGPAEGSLANAHYMFGLMNASGEGIPLSRYVELDMEF